MTLPCHHDESTVCGRCMRPDDFPDAADVALRTAIAERDAAIRERDEALAELRWADAEHALYRRQHRVNGLLTFFARGQRDIAIEQRDAAIRERDEARAELRRMTDAHGDACAALAQSHRDGDAARAALREALDGWEPCAVGAWGDEAHPDRDAIARLRKVLT